MRSPRLHVRRLGAATLCLGLLATLSSCNASSTSTTSEPSQGGSERLTRSEVRFVEIATDAQAQFLTTATSLLLLLPEISEGGVSTDEVQEVIDAAYATLEVWDGFTAPSERFAPAVDAWFGVLDEQWEFISSWVDLANEPTSKPLLKGALKQLAVAGDEWATFKEEVTSAAESVEGGLDRVQPILDGLEGYVQEVLDEFGS